MSSRFRGSSLLLLAALAVAAVTACDREERKARGAPLPETGPAQQAALSTTHSDPRAKQYENVSFQISQGQRLYGWMNCVGCHAHGGGGMGPPLMDEKWRYGGSMEDIVATIQKGRPNGMPSFEHKLTEQQAWQLAAYVRSLSAQPRQDVLSARADEMSNTEPQTLDERKPVKDAAGSEPKGPVR
jgi:cytochrome c oxidase cbb3-type subunit 3